MEQSVLRQRRERLLADLTRAAKALDPAEAAALAAEALPHDNEALRAGEGASPDDGQFEHLGSE